VFGLLSFKVEREPGYVSGLKRGCRNGTYVSNCGENASKALWGSVLQLSVDVMISLVPQGGTV
jgi:hypothetical protein